ncbi:MAG: hypothetical protein Q4D38_13435 [Planctomycetia bacterium]|nr:hypothetical protein [Planctomycetia bacterium]
MRQKTILSDWSPVSLRVCRLVFVCTLVFTFVFVPVWTSAHAGALQTLIRRAGKIGDDVPLRSMDDLATSPGTRKIAGETFGKAKHLHDSAAYTKRLIRQIEEVVGASADPALLKSLRQLDDAGLETVLLASRGSRNLVAAAPDIAHRADLFRKLDGETLCLIGRYDNLARDAYIFEQTRAAGRIVSPPGVRGVTLDDFGNFFKKTGEKGYEFWQTSVRPHWKLWATSGVLATILLAPESYSEYAIEVASDGVQKIVRVAGAVVEESANVAGAVVSEGIRSTGEGVGAAVEDIGTSLDEGSRTILKSFFRSVWGTLTFCAIVIFALWSLSRIAIVRKTLRKICAALRFCYRLIFPIKNGNDA